MRYCDCLPILLAFFSLFPLNGVVSRKLTNQAKGDAKAGIVHPGNKKDMEYIREDNPGLFQVQEDEGPT